MQSPITQENIEDIILNLIRTKYEKSRIQIENEKNRLIEELEKLDIAWEKCEEFEKKHLEELQSIYSLPTKSTRSFPTNYLEGAFYSIGRDYENTKYLLQRLNEDQFFLHGISLTYIEIERETGISSHTAKKYFDILVRKGKIISKRAIGGTLYKLLENE